MINKIRVFLQAVKGEMKRVSWPSRPRIIRSTLVVVIAVIIFAVFIGGVDLIFYQILKFFLK